MHVVADAPTVCWAAARHTVIFRVADEVNLHSLHEIDQLLSDVTCPLHAAQLDVILIAELAAEVRLSPALR